VTGWQSHLVKLGDIPAGKNVPAGSGIVPNSVDQRGDLVDPLIFATEKPLACRRISRPIDPLLAVHRSEIAPTPCKGLVVDYPLLERIPVDWLAGLLAIFVERPVGPDVHLLLHQFADIGITGQEPEHFARRRFPEYALGGE